MTSTPSTPSVDHKAREVRFAKVVRMFLDGVSDRWPPTAPMEKYAHVFKGSLSVCVTDHDELDPADLKESYDSAGGWKWLGTIDLDDGELVASSGDTALGRG